MSEPTKMDFDLFQSICRYQGLAYMGSEGARLEFEPTCRHPDKFPNGFGRGPCDEPHCPYYGKRLILEGDRK